MSRFINPLLILTILLACTTKSMKKNTEIPEAESISTAYVIKEIVNLRSDNNTNSEIIKKLMNGQQIGIIRNVNGWYEVYDDERNKGWLRSDMVGPKELSRTLLATAFVDSVLPGFKTKMYFDKTHPYKKIYLILPNNYYESQSKAENYARQIGKVYQEKVYPGELEIRIMNKSSEELFTRLQLKAMDNPTMPVPILQKGRLVSINQKNWQIKITIAVPSDIANSELLEQARDISSIYELPYNTVEIYQVIDNKPGLTYSESHTQKSADVHLCKLYYLEDKDGEYYKYNHSE